MEASPEKRHVTVCLCRHTHPSSVQFTSVRGSSPCQNRQAMSASRVSLGGGGGGGDFQNTVAVQLKKERKRERERERKMLRDRGCLVSRG